MATSGPINRQGYFIYTTSGYDSEVIHGLDVNTPDFKDFLVYLQTALTDTANYLNTRAGGELNPSELISGKTLFSPQGTSLGSTSNIRRQNLWVSVLIGPLETAGVPATFAHNIPNVNNANFMGVYLYGSITDPVAFTTISLPYAGPLGTVCLEYDQTNLIITASFNATNFTQGVVTIEYVKY